MAQRWRFVGRDGGNPGNYLFQLGDDPKRWCSMWPEYFWFGVKR